MSAFFGNIRSQLRTVDTLQRLLLVNVVVFLAVTFSKAIAGLFMVFLNVEKVISPWMAVPAYLPNLATHPWTIITYMFYHYEFFHILFNMLWLYWMGRIFQEYLGNKKLFSTYILGGISGALLYIIAYNIFPLFSNSLEMAVALGASASVLAITVAAATLVPEYRVGLLFIGAVPLKYIAIVTIALDVAQISSNNAGGHIAHLGGALFGFVYIRQLKHGKDIAAWFNNMMDRLVSGFSGRGHMKVKHRRFVPDEEYVMEKKAKQERVDAILEKISRSGYGSLSQEEKDFLFKSSKEN